MSKITAKTKIVAQNKKARFNYEILETLEAGLVLTGSEVKSIRLGRVSLKEGYIAIKEGEAYLLSSHIAEYSFAGCNSHDSLRERKLLLHKKQLVKLAAQVKTKGITLLPLKLYLNKRNLVKLEVGIAKGKALHDKRSVLKERDARREADQALKKCNQL